MSDPWEADDVAEEARAAAVNFEAVLISLRKDKNGINLVLSVSPIDVPESILLAPVGSRYQIAAVRIDDDEMPVKQPLNDGDRAIVRASQLVQDESFQDWMRETKRALSANERAALQGIYTECGIASRKELRGNVEARLAFQKLVDLYDEHLRRGGAG